MALAWVCTEQMHDTQQSMGWVDGRRMKPETQNKECKAERWRRFGGGWRKVRCWHSLLHGKYMS
jgi:hypothetical protein